jgi:hypothetical protein
VDIIFCFGFAIPNPQVLAVRPRSVGIADLGVVGDVHGGVDMAARCDGLERDAAADNHGAGRE